MTAALFDAPQHEGQAALFGGLYLSADELGDQAAELDPAALYWQQTERLSHGESVPGGPGACATCGHARPWHSTTNRQHPCYRDDCPCSRYQGPRS